MKHKHHIIPKYMGGSDDPSNLIEVTITQHIMWHFANWQRMGNYQDKLAYKLLANTDASEEKEILRIQKSREVMKSMTPEERRNKNKLSTEIKRTPEARKSLSIKMRQQRSNGLALTEEGRQRIEEGAMKARIAQSKSVRHIPTNTIYASIRLAARETNTGRNTIKRSIKGGGNWEKV